MNRNGRPVCLNLCDLKLTDNDIPTIIEGLKKDPKINQLDLSNNLIGNRGIRELLRSPYMNKIFYFNLYQNQIGDEGAVAVVRSSRYNSIASLNLSRNQLTAEGIKALAQHIPGSKLVNLALIFNQGVNDKSAFQAILEATKKHPPLQYLHIPSAFNKQIKPVLLENRRIVALTKQALLGLISDLKQHDTLSYPMSNLDWYVLVKFQEYYLNQMLNSPLTAGPDSIVTCKKLHNYINDNFLKITGVVRDDIELEDDKEPDVTLADLPPELLSRITRFCTISDVKHDEAGAHATWHYCT